MWKTKPTVLRKDAETHWSQRRGNSQSNEEPLPTHQASMNRNMRAELECGQEGGAARMANGNENYVVHGMNNLETSIKIINIPALQLNIPTLRNLPREIKTAIRKDTKTHL